MFRIMTTVLLAATVAGCASTPSSSMTSRGSGLNMYEQQIMDQLDAHHRALSSRRRGLTMDDNLIGQLREGESDFLRATLNRGNEVIITGACDQDCTDVDLIIRDDRGRELDRDTAVDDYPVLNFRAPYDGDYEIEVVMYRCSVEPCYFGVALFSN